MGILADILKRKEYGEIPVDFNEVKLDSASMGEMVLDSRRTGSLGLWVFDNGESTTRARFSARWYDYPFHAEVHRPGPGLWWVSGAERQALSGWLKRGGGLTLSLDYGRLQDEHGHRYPRAMDPF